MKFNFGSSREMINTRIESVTELFYPSKNINSFDIEGNQDSYEYSY